jgi:hypothetical protein
MTCAIPTYAVSINANITDKPDGVGISASAKGWEPLELSERGLADSIRRGRPYAPQFRAGQRKTANFTCAGFLAADVDRGVTLEQAQNHAFVRHHATLIHTTASHTEEHHRFRIVFLLDEPLILAPDWEAAQLGLALMLGGDRSVTDGARLFFGNTKAIIFSIGRTVPPKVVADLIARGRDARASRAPGGGLLPVVSVRRLAGPELIKLAGGQLVRLVEIGVGERVHCPHHDDGDPSAFTLRFRNGQIGIHCSACKVTFGSNERLDDYDFGAFDRLFEESQAGQQENDPDAPGLDRFFPPAPRFERHQARFLPHLAYEPGITLVKSPKGSGKTEALRFMLDRVRAGQFRADIPRKDRPRSVLLIGHRQALLREAAAKLDLRCYLDPGEGAEGPLRTLAVTLDSLPKYNESNGGSSRRAFDLVIIDESEQVLGHLFGETIKKGRGLERCFDALNFEVANAKAVIALDADLGLVTTHALRTMRPQDWASRCRIVYNAPMAPEQRRVMRLHRDVKVLEREMIEAIKRGERCFIVSNSKKYVDVVHRMILNECGEAVVMRVVTSDNSRDEATVRFLANIKTEFLVVQVVLGTPSIGTGIDITFANGECKVDRVFGIFKSFVNTHMDIDQQLCRVRNPGMVDIWISPATFAFTCNVQVIKDDLARAYIVTRAVKGRRDDGMVDYDRDDPLLTICAHVTALQRASKNRLVELFCALRRANGWDVQSVYETEPMGNFHIAKQMVEAERKESLLKAEPLDDPDYVELDELVSKGAVLTKEERVRHERSRFERTVGAPLDLELIELNVDGKLLERIVNLAGIVLVWSNDNLKHLIDVLLASTSLPKGRLQGMKPEMLVAVLMRAAGLTNEDGFASAEPVSLDSLSRFVDVCRENRTVIEEVLGVAFRADFAEKPVRQLNVFLKRVGLELRVTKTEKPAGRKVRYYSVSVGLLGTMMRLARSYLDAEARRESEKERARIDGPGRRAISSAWEKFGDESLKDVGLFSPDLLRKTE